MAEPKEYGRIIVVNAEDKAGSCTLVDNPYFRVYLGIINFDLSRSLTWINSVLFEKCMIRLISSVSVHLNVLCFSQKTKNLYSCKHYN